MIIIFNNECLFKYFHCYTEWLIGLREKNYTNTILISKYQFMKNRPCDVNIFSYVMKCKKFYISSNTKLFMKRTISFRDYGMFIFIIRKF